MPTQSISSGDIALPEAPPKMLDSPPEAIRIAMWSGPRNISTAMMRSFGSRSDTAVIDEPFYAAYLRATGLNHPMRDEVLASQENDWRNVVHKILGPVPDERPIWYQKHMTHHMLPEFGRDWIDQVTSAFLIRRPESVLASYGQKRVEVSLRDIGFVEQLEIFEDIANRIGQPPPVVDCADVLANPRRVLGRLCEALDIPFRREMLSWEPGRHASDGVWAVHWYHAVEASTGFARPRAEIGFDDLPDHLKGLADLARPYYEKMREYMLV
jgi:hypothetical protein